MLTGIAAAGVGALSSFVGNLFDNKRQAQALQAQMEENQKNRDYNLMLAKLQNQWNIEQWQRENAYNTPLAQMQRLAQADINPDLYYGEGSASNLSAPSPELTSGAPSSPADMSLLAQRRTVGEMVSEAARTALSAAQVRNLNKDSDKKGQETANLKVENGILTADALTRAAQNEQSIEFTKSQIYLNHSMADLNHREAELVAQRCNEVAANTDKLYAERDHTLRLIKSLDVQDAERMLNMYLNKASTEARIKEIAANIRNLDANTYKTQVEAEQAVKSFLSRMLYLGAQTESARSQSILLDITSERASFNLDKDKEFVETERTLNMVNGIVGSLGSLIGSAAGAFFGSRGALSSLAKRPSIKGFGK